MASDGDRTGCPVGNVRRGWQWNEKRLRRRDRRKSCSRERPPKPVPRVLRPDMWKLRIGQPTQNCVKRIARTVYEDARCSNPANGRQGAEEPLIRRKSGDSQCR